MQKLCLGDLRTTFFTNTYTEREDEKNKLIILQDNNVWYIKVGKEIKEITKNTLNKYLEKHYDQKDNKFFPSGLADFEGLYDFFLFAEKIDDCKRVNYLQKLFDLKQTDPTIIAARSTRETYLHFA